ncbi:MAG TPA: SAM-dependent chlorinase/fluorinase [Anaerolineae bacterium]|nr:SAM-dependent chlorinase/fluorinase [Anaerolineae bacterium]
MELNGIITFTTDFGTRDPYIGMLKGIVLTANPHAYLVDITHEIPAHDIVNAAFTLVRSYQYFPIGTIHVAIVDPGVGGQRKNIAMMTERYIFVGPDNGIFSLVLSKEKPREIREIKNPPFILKTISDTFHGRDIFAPCAGHLSAGKMFTDIGPVIRRLKNLKYPEVTRDGNKLMGEVVAIDSFGNMITNITRHTYNSFSGKMRTEIFFGAVRFDRIMRHYEDVVQGSPLVLFGSSGYMEVSMNEGSAAVYFMASVGSPVTIRRY